MDFKKMANLDEIKMMARGNPQKIAEYKMKLAELEELKVAHFNDDYPFVNGFNESHLEELRKFAEGNPDDESAQIRYELQKERFATQENRKTAHIDLRIARSELQSKLAAGERLSKSDLVMAEKLARQNTSPENMAMYSQIKLQINEGADE
ncbi:hypothetical protein QNK12_09970 [Neobacillus cucumis]|nr:hypothetical protein QNK12_09970 [Neobacillus cucumis]